MLWENTPGPVFLLLGPTHLRDLRQHSTDYLTRRISEFDGFLEAGKTPVVTVASKSGTIRGTRNDVGLVAAHGRCYVLAVMSKGCADRRFYQDNEGSVLLPKVSEVTYRHFVASAVTA